MKMRPMLHIVAGPNGAGKTTFATRFLPKYAHCKEFVNADLIAKGLSPFDPDAATFSAGRIVLHRIKDFLEKKCDFGFETTLSGKTYLPILRDAKESGYRIHFYFLWLPSPSLALKRIADRVKAGGHDVPAAVVRRRYALGMQNFFQAYDSIADMWMVFDNSRKIPREVARMENGLISIKDKAIYGLIRKSGALR